MIDFVAQIGFGVFLIMFGARLLIQPRWYAVFRGTYVDFSNYHILWGVVWIVAGTLLLFLTIRRKISIRNKRKETEELREGKK